MHEGFESVRVIGESVVVAGDGLNPHRRHQPNPFAPAPTQITAHFE